MYQLNLFKTDFDLSEKHADKAPFHRLWNSDAVLADLHREARARPTFLLHDGPPYANGSLHLGHFANKALKDALLKFKRLQGVFAPFVPGFDCHGLPVELEVEKLGHSKLDAKGFVAACRSYAAGQVAQQTREFAAFGVAADWERPYLTMDPAFEAGAARCFTRLPQVVKRLRPVHWCPACASSLAEAEVEYKSRTSPSVVVLFELVDAPGTFLQVWTTTPYTLPANKAVAFNAGLDYVEVAEGARRLVRARREDDPAGLPHVDLAGRTVKSPYTGQVVPVLAADYVSSTGTGLVHLAPSFGMDDFRVGEAHGLAVESFVDAQGRFLEGGPAGAALAGQSLAAAQRTVLAALGELLYAQEERAHEYPHCWRHKSPLFFKASEEWFLDLAELGPRAARALAQVNFVPASGRERMGAMLGARTSWCLSRTRLWGTPLADPTDPEQLARLEEVAVHGVEAWQAGSPRRTLDVWFDSGVTHELVMRARFGRGADLVVEGTDQHRGWFQSSLLTSVALHGTAPYATVLTHGFVLDEKGNKYSKSSANYEPLAATLDKLSPDVLRLWALSQDMTRDLKMGRESLARTGERYRKLRNTLRFCLQNTQDAPKVPAEVTGALHLAQLAELSALVRTVTEAAERYDLPAAVAALVHYGEAVSGEYFTAVKDALYCEAPDAPRRRQAQAVLQRMLAVLVRLLVPLLPYTAEEAYQQLRARLPREAGAPATSLQLTLSGLGLPDTAASAPEAALLLQRLAQLRALRQAVHRHVEASRDDFLKGPAQLALAVTLPAGAPVTAADLEDFFDCAQVTVQPGAAPDVRWTRTALPRCRRCRRHRELASAGLCGRCQEVEESTAAAL
jgi:isoleucyl-tRNA synthetase